MVTGWMPLLTFNVTSQGQHIVGQYSEVDVPEMDLNDPATHSAQDMFKGMDSNADGLVSRR